MIDRDQLREALYQFDAMVGESRLPPNSNLSAVVEAARLVAEAQEIQAESDGSARIINLGFVKGVASGYLVIRVDE